MNKYRMMPFFEESGGAAGGAAPAADPAKEPAAEPGNGGKDDGAPQSLTDVLKAHPDFQKEIDRRINQAVETATKNERERQQIIQDNLQDEMIRVSKMTDEEKDEYLKKKAEAAANKREADLTRRELTLDARTALQDKGLPEAFLPLLSYQDKDAMLASVNALDEAFRCAVQKGVDDKLKGQQPPKDAKTEGHTPSPQTDTQKAIAEAMKYAGLKTK